MTLLHPSAWYALYWGELSVHKHQVDVLFVLLPRLSGSTRLMRFSPWKKSSRMRFTSTPSASLTAPCPTAGTSVLAAVLPSCCPPSSTVPPLAYPLARHAGQATLGHALNPKVDTVQNVHG